MEIEFSNFVAFNMLLKFGGIERAYAVRDHGYQIVIEDLDSRVRVDRLHFTDRKPDADEAKRILSEAYREAKRFPG